MLPRNAILRYFRNLSLALLLPFLFLPTSFGKTGNFFEAVSKVFQDKTNGVSGTNSYNLKISKKALEKEYLLSTSYIPQFGAPTSTALKAKIIRFKKFGKTLDIYDVSGGTNITPEDFPTQRILAQLPILRESMTHYIVDFNVGLKNLYYVEWSTTTGDFMFDEFLHTLSAKVLMSRVFEITSENQSTTTIKQLVALDEQSFFGSLAPQYELRHFITEHKKDTFQALQSNPNHKNVGYFTTRAMAKEKVGASFSNILKFDLNEGPITFYYSENTPEEYVESIVKGVLYWNQAFDKDVIQIQKAPKGVYAPNATRNMIQWVENEEATFAYADIIANPRSGKIHRGQAYLPSSWAVGSIRNARHLLLKLRKSSKSQTSIKNKKEIAIDFAFHGSAKLCDFGGKKMEADFQKGLADLLLNPDITDAAVLEFSKAYVAMVVTHEVGHVLGLAHNFAGSLDSTITNKERDQELSSFAMNTKYQVSKDKKASSSSMDYLSFSDRMFTGIQILQGRTIAPHDLAAIRYSYYGDMTAINEKMLYCNSTSEAWLNLDCDRFDSGPAPLLGKIESFQGFADQLAIRIFMTYVRQVTAEDPIYRRQVKEVSLNSSYFTELYKEQLEEIFSWFDEGANSLLAKSAFDADSDLFDEQIQLTYWDLTLQQVKMAGGIEQSIMGNLPMYQLKGFDKGFDPHQTLAELENLINHPEAYPFVGMDGKRYRFTEEERKIILERSAILLMKLAHKLPETFLEVVNELKIRPRGQIADDPLSAILEQAILNYALFIIATESEEQISFQLGEEELSVSKPFFKFKTRMLATDIIANPDIGSFSGWSLDTSKKVHSILKERVMTGLKLEDNQHPDSIQFAATERAIKVWLNEIKEIMGKLPR